MALGDLFGRREAREELPSERMTLPAPPGRDDLGAALDRVDAMVAGGAVPSCVAARVERVTHVVRDTIPRLDTLRGSTHGYWVMATATDYLPEALSGYLRLPRRFADTRPVDGGRTSLMVLVDQLDLLGATMDDVFDAVCRDDAVALVAHGRFLAEKFGQASDGGRLMVDLPVPPPRPSVPVASEPAGQPVPLGPPVLGEPPTSAEPPVSGEPLVPLEPPVPPEPATSTIAPTPEAPTVTPAPPSMLELDDAPRDVHR
ncbi:MAG: hypothetical protein ABI746_07810 [Dermatophilaceae bacterium]